MMINAISVLTLGSPTARAYHLLLLLGDCSRRGYGSVTRFSQSAIFQNAKAPIFLSMFDFLNNKSSRVSPSVTNTKYSCEKQPMTVQEEIRIIMWSCAADS